jgi:short-subunit dehydrogenase
MQAEMLAVNVVALTELTRRIVPGMLDRRAGRILNMASTAAFQPGPLMATYYATKAFVLSFSLALCGELGGTGVTCTAFCPGPTATGFQARAEMAESRLVAGRTLPTAEHVASFGYRSMMKGKSLAVDGAGNRAFAFGTRLMPRPHAARIVMRAQQRVSP